MKTIKQISIILPLIAVFMAMASVMCFVHRSYEGISKENITLNSTEETYGLQVYEVNPEREYIFSFNAVGSGNVQLCTDLYAGDAYDSAENDHYVPVDGTAVSISFDPYHCNESTYIRFILTGNGSVNISNICISSSDQENGKSGIIGIICAIISILLIVIYTAKKIQNDNIQPFENTKKESSLFQI